MLAGIALLTSSLVLPDGAAANGGDYIHLARGGSGLARTDADGSSPTSLVSGTFFIGVTATSSYLYWANYSTNYVGRSALDGSGANASWLNLGSSSNAITTDGTYLYIARSWANRIARVKLDGTELQPDFITTTHQPGGVLVAGGKIYWSNFGNAGGTTVGRADLDGTNATNTFLTGLTAPVGLASDGTYLYWLQYGGAGTIGRALLDGTSPDPAFVTGVAYGWDITYGNGKLWFDVSDKLGSVELDGSGLNTSVRTGIAGYGRGIWVGGVASPTPSPSATPEPSAEPTPEPSAEPTPEPSVEPTGDPQLHLSTATAVGGQDVVVTGSGFKPGTDVALWLNSTPVLLKTVTTLDGSFNTTVRIPVGTTAGSHTIVAMGVGADELPLEMNAPITVTSLDLPATDISTSASPGWIDLLRILLFGGGSALVVTSLGRRRPDATHG